MAKKALIDTLTDAKKLLDAIKNTEEDKMSDNTITTLDTKNNLDKQKKSALASWIKIVIFAVIAGLYTAVMAILPAAKDTSFADITVTIECWALFGLLIIKYSSSPLDSALKCFVFFLVSQPLVYLVQVPFYEGGWSIFNYYGWWFMWTIATLPMGFIGYYMKRDKWWGLLIIAPLMCLVAATYMRYLDSVITWFPHHLLTVIFCIISVMCYPILMFKDKKIRIAGIIMAAIILVAASCAGITSEHEFYTTDILASETSASAAGGITAASESGASAADTTNSTNKSSTNAADNESVYFDDTYTAALADESYGDVSIVYEEGAELYVIHAEFKKPGETQLVITSPTSETVTYDLTIGKDTYHLERLS